MTKVICAKAECKYNDDNNKCTRKEINLSCCSVMTVNDGRQEYNRCRSFEESEESKRLKAALEEIMTKESFEEWAKSRK